MKAGLRALCFLVGGRPFAADIMGIGEILRNQSFTEIPHTPPHVAGVLNLRGEIIPVVDLHRVLLGRPSPLPHQEMKLVVAHARGRTAGLLVDQVLDVVALSPGDLAPVPGGYGDDGVKDGVPVVLATFPRADAGEGEIVVLIRFAPLVEGVETSAPMEAPPC